MKMQRPLRLLFYVTVLQPMTSSIPYSDLSYKYILAIFTKMPTQMNSTSAKDIALSLCIHYTGTFYLRRKAKLCAKPKPCTSEGEGKLRDVLCTGCTSLGSSLTTGPHELSSPSQRWLRGLSSARLAPAEAPHGLPLR